MLTNNGLDLCPQDYDYHQLKAIKARYGEDPSKQPCFIEIPLQRTLSLNVFGKGESPQENQERTHYLGKRTNVKVGQILVCSCFLWHATALPCPIYGVVGTNVGEYVTYFDFRLHLYLGCEEVDVDDQNLTLPLLERGFTHRTTYVSPQNAQLSRFNLFYQSSIFHKDKQIDQTVEFVLPPASLLPREYMPP